MTAPVGGELALFKYNGARILDNPLMIDGQRKAWTVGHYLRVLKKSPSAVTLGVGSQGSPSPEKESQKVCTQTYV